jgi:tight adherence protein B
MAPEQILILAVAGVIALAVIGVGVYLSRREDDIVEYRLGRLDMTDEELNEQYKEVKVDSSEIPRENRQVSVLEDSRRLLDPFNNLLTERKFGKKWRQQLARANLRLTVAEFAASHAVTAGTGFTLGYLLLFPGDIIMSMVAGLIGLFLPRIYVSRAISKRLIAFEEQLPDTLGLWVNALRSGYSVLQAMEAIAKDAPDPTKTEFVRVVKEVQLGIDMDDALDHMLDRVDSDDLDLVVTAVNINREVGGNLSEILDVISHTIRERIKLKGEIRVLTSQGRITGYLISFLPISLALFLNFASPGYMGDMFSNRACGWPMLGVALALIGIGTAVIQKIIDIEI